MGNNQTVVQWKHFPHKISEYNEFSPSISARSISFNKATRTAVLPAFKRLKLACSNTAPVCLQTAFLFSNVIKNGLSGAFGCGRSHSGCFAPQKQFFSPCCEENK